MYLKSMSWIAILALLPAVFLISSPIYMIALELLICWAAGLLVFQAFRARKFLWAAAFLAVTLALNPVIPITVSQRAFMWLVAACIAVFVASLFSLNTVTATSALSIVGPPKHGDFEKSW